MHLLTLGWWMVNLGKRVFLSLFLKGYGINGQNTSPDFNPPMPGQRDWTSWGRDLLAPSFYSSVTTPTTSLHLCSIFNPFCHPYISLPNTFLSSLVPLVPQSPLLTSTSHWPKHYPTLFCLFVLSLPGSAFITLPFCLAYCPPGHFNPASWPNS